MKGKRVSTTSAVDTGKLKSRKDKPKTGTNMVGVLHSRLAVSVLALAGFVISLYVGSVIAFPIYSSELSGNVATISLGGSRIADIELIDNTNQCISDCEATLKIHPYVDIDIPDAPDSNYNWIFEKSSLDSPGLESYAFLLKTNKEYTASIPIYSACSRLVYHDPSNTSCAELSCSEYSKTQCSCPSTCITSYEQENNTYETYEPFQFWGYKLSAGSDYVIKIVGKKGKLLGENNIDWKLRFSSVLLDNWAWWNSSWGNYVNYTFTDSLATNINRTGEPVTVNVTGLTLVTNNCTEIALVNSSGIQLNYVVKSNGTTGPADGSKWCVLEHQITKTSSQSAANYSYYYNTNSVGNDHPKTSYVSKTAGSNPTYNGSTWSGTWDDSSGVGFNNNAFKDEAGIALTQEASWGIFNAYDGTNWIRASYGSGSTSHNGCNPVYCELNSTASNCKFSVKLYDRYVIYESVVCTSTYEAYFNSFFGTSRAWCRYSDNSCATNTEETWGVPEKGYWYNHTTNTYQLVWYENTTQGYNAWKGESGAGFGMVVPAWTQGGPERLSSIATKVVFGFMNRTDGIISANQWIDMFDQPVNITRGATANSGLTEQEARAAILQGITTSSIGSSATVYDSQQVYIRLANGTQHLGTFDKMAVYGNQRWLFNYITSGESATNITGIGTVLNVWENQSLTSSSVIYQVSSVINSTKA